MITFDTTLETALQSVLTWNKKAGLNSVRIVRDVFGKVSFLLDNTEAFTENDIQTLTVTLEKNLGSYFSGRIYCKKVSKSKQNEAERMAPIIQLLEESGREWRTEEGILFYVSERTIAKKAWINNSLQHDAVWPYEDAVEGSKPKVVTFYSFKGGMGRTTALAGVALSLIKRGHSVMMVDTDIEAPGLASLFLDEGAVEKGVLDYLIECSIEERDIREYVIDITDTALLDEQDANLYLLAAGKVDTNYLQKLARIDYQDNKENHLRHSLEKMLHKISQEYDVDYILIDARAGFHDMGGITVSQIPHGAVLIGNDTRQSWEGMTQVLKTIAEGHDDDLPIVLVDSMCEKPTSANFAEMKKNFENKSYTVCLENYYSEDSVKPGPEAEGVAHAPVFVPFNDALLQGIILYSSGSSEQDNVVKAYKELLTEKTYKAITDRVVGWFGGEDDDN